jgi:2-polyprenyl-6-methoxyphenol hydroxylase-like FAD-dependent oxidoreductase
MTSVSIAGGGIGGLVAAMCLHDAGHDVDVFESVVEPSELGVGINVRILVSQWDSDMGRTTRARGR